MEEELIRLAEKPMLLKKDMRRIEELSLELNTDFPVTDCPDAYKKQITILLDKIEPNVKHEIIYKLRDTVDIIWKNKRVNPHTITPEIAEDLIESGLIGLFKKT